MVERLPLSSEVLVQLGPDLQCFHIRNIGFLVIRISRQQMPDILALLGSDLLRWRSRFRSWRKPAAKPRGVKRARPMVLDNLQPRLRIETRKIEALHVRQE